MNPKIKKGLRTLQSEFPVLKEAKDVFYYKMRSVLAIPHESDFRALRHFGPNSNRVLIDVGANQGQSIESMLIYMPSAQIVSFEANPDLAQKLRARYEQNRRISVIARGLSDSTGTLTLYVPSYKRFVYDGLASFDKKEAASWINEQRIFGFNPARLTIAEITCQVSTLDAEQLAPSFVKVDVQGYEYNVLKGGVQTLRMYEPVLLVESFRNDPRTTQLAEELGYEEYNFDSRSLRKGPPHRSPNSFLITRRTAKILFP
jgi:FkbM family methyltransferase